MWDHEEIFLKTAKSNSWIKVLLLLPKIHSIFLAQFSGDYNWITNSSFFSVGWWNNLNFSMLMTQYTNW